LKQHMSALDPNQVVQQIWRGDYPASWRVFVGEESNRVSNFLTALLVVIAVPLFCILVNGSVVLLIEAAKQGGFPYMATLFVIVVLGVLVALCILAFRAIKRYRSKQPKPMIVVMPDGVVGYRRKKVWAVAFADVAHMQLRAETTVSTPTSYTSTIWLDLIYQGGQRGECFIEIAPQEMIAQNILEAHTAFRLQYQG
jgi:hypothetical protein